MSLLISGNKLRIAGGEGGRSDEVAGRWTLGRVCAMVSAVNCVRLMNHRPVPLKQIMYYMLIKRIKSAKNKVKFHIQNDSVLTKLVIPYLANFSIILKYISFIDIWNQNIKSLR